jgi:hypothetical protein
MQDYGVLLTIRPDLIRQAAPSSWPTKQVLGVRGNLSLDLAPARVFSCMPRALAPGQRKGGNLGR